MKISGLIKAVCFCGLCTPEEPVPSFQIISVIPSGFPNWDEILTRFLKAERETRLSSKNNQDPAGCNLKSSAKNCVTSRGVLPGSGSLLTLGRVKQVEFEWLGGHSEGREGLQ